MTPIWQQHLLRGEKQKPKKNKDLYTSFRYNSRVGEFMMQNAFYGKASGEEGGSTFAVIMLLKALVITTAAMLSKT